MDSISERWDVIARNCNIPKREFLKAVSFVLHSTYFIFDKQIYRQTFRLSMGSPLSPIIADLVMRDLEERAIEKLGLALPFYYRYVDDVALTIPPNMVNETFRDFQLFPSYTAIHS